MNRNALALVLPLLASACGGEEPGTIKVTVYGEEFIEEGIPADAFSDGWAVTFDSFLVSIGNIAGQAGHGNEEVGDPAFYIVDLAQPSGGEGFEVTTFDAPPGHYDHFGYQIAPAPSATAPHADAADATAMKASGYSVWVRGSATKTEVTKTFDWGFTLKLTYAHCDLGGSVDGNELVAQATIHADHLFYDDAVSEEPNLAFQLIADADGADGTTADGTITFDELAAVDIRGQTRYQVGSLKDPAGNTITNLLQYIQHQVVTLGHINGEGHCEDQIGQP